MADDSDWSATRTVDDGPRGLAGAALAPRHPDWPVPGTLDLRVHDLPHDSSSIEWWYVNAHLTTASGTPYSLFASFFRVDADAEGTDAGRSDPARRRSHFVVWAITDVRGRAYHADSRLDPRAPADGLRRIDRGRGGQDPRIRRALREVFAKGHVPLPDRLLEVEGTADTTRLHLDYGGNRFQKQDDGSYRLKIADAARGLSASLTFAPEKPAIRHGADGVVCTDGDTEMFYYFVPRCRVDGALQVGGEALQVTGSGWYDHEFGTSPGEESGPTAAGQAWNWIALQLDDGTDVTVFEVMDVSERTEPRVLEHRAIVVDPAGARRELTDFVFEPTAYWTSCSTFNAYPTRWRLELPGVEGVLDVECTFPQQEFLTVLSPPAFWEGRVEATGTLGGRAVRGLGYVERTGFCDIESLDDFFAAVGRETRRAIDALVPAAPSAAEAERALGGERWRDSLKGLDVDQYVRTVIAPIRHIVESGGKAWRSYGFLACIDLAGGPVEDYRAWLALPELLHVGSLIVDDVEDRSEVRRDAPACHTLFGEALAINAGTACYFLAELVLSGANLSADKRARGYALYFEAMRAAHAGQALDIDGQHHLLPKVVESGDSGLLEARVLAVHRLKSAVPPAALARVAALLSDASAEVGAGLSALFESYGVAFQIVDDVLNLRGFENGLKQRGEDIRAGKVTAPVARALGLLGPAGRRRLAEILTARVKDAAQVAEAIALVDGCGALDACASEARALVESAWQRVDAILPDSQAKVRLRAFGWFILDRHY